jgi:hypothetical protein
MSSPAFTRTPPGLSNQSAFLGVDIVVFTESGSRTLSITEVEQGLQNGETPDSAFWRAVIETYSPQNRTFHLKTVGSKHTVRAIANMVATGQITKVAAAMDRDLDHFRGTNITHTNVIYTRGYSWENDIWTAKISNAVFRSMIPDRQERAHADSQIKTFFNDLEQCFHTAVRLDRSLASTGADTIPRESLEDTVRPSPPENPLLLRNDLAVVISQVRRENPNLKRHPNQTDILMDLHGHTLAKAGTNFLRSLIQSISSHKISNALLTSMALSEFMRDTQSSAMMYYRTSILNIVW